jgi:Mg-chelatase subunit ChlD
VVAFLTALLQLLVVPLFAAVAWTARIVASVWAVSTAWVVKGYKLGASVWAVIVGLLRAFLFRLMSAVVALVAAVARPFRLASTLAGSTLASCGRAVIVGGAAAARAGGRLSSKATAVSGGFAASYWEGLVVAGRATWRAIKLAMRAASVTVAGGVVILLVYSGYAALNPEPTVTVVHWTTGHLLRDGSGLRLLRQMADEFNDAGYRNESGKQVRVEVHYAGGSEQSLELISRMAAGHVINAELPDPALVTPSASHWLVNVNHAAGREVFDLRDTESRSLARTYVGIVTYKAMADCLGWPDSPIGYAEIIQLRNHPAGWAAYDCAKLEWGQRPLFAFTDPSTSDTGRAVLLSLYAIAAQKAPEDLTMADLQRPEVVDFVRTFQGLVDHYMPATIPLNTKVCEGPRYGHFFLMPEDNLAHLIDGTEECLINGVEQNAPSLQEPMIIAYPHEGSLLREHCACAVKAPWVSEEEATATELWVAFLREERQQRSFVTAGFRPGTDLEVPPSTVAFSEAPANALHTERIHPEVAAAIDASWDLVKRPAVVTFVADTSGSMLGNKLQEEKDGLLLAVEDMAPNNWFGLISFDDSVKPLVEIAPVAHNRLGAKVVINEMKAGGETALYEAIKAAILMTDGAQAEPNAIRAVVVITDGLANRGTTCLDDLVAMTSSREVAVSSYCGFAEDTAVDVEGSSISKSDIRGIGLAIPTQHPVQVFFVAIGEDADLDIGRIFAGASGAEFRGATEADLAEVIEEFSRYF